MEWCTPIYLFIIIILYYDNILLPPDPKPERSKMEEYHTSKKGLFWLWSKILGEIEVSSPRTGQNLALIRSEIESLGKHGDACIKAFICYLIGWSRLMDLCHVEYFILRQESQLASLSYSVWSLIDDFILLPGNKLDSRTNHYWSPSVAIIGAGDIFLSKKSLYLMGKSYRNYWL